MKELSLPTYQEIEKNEKIVKITKYGEIKLFGEKEPRKVSWKTYEMIKNLPEDFTGTIEIEELSLSIKFNQIVRMEEVEYKEFAKLPTESVLLDEYFNIISLPEKDTKEKYDMYYRATCHYQEKNGEKVYDLDRNHIKELLRLTRVWDGYSHVITNISKYGVQEWP